VREEKSAHSQQKRGRKAGIPPLRRMVHGYRAVAVQPAHHPDRHTGTDGVVCLHRPSFFVPNRAGRREVDTLVRRDLASSPGYGVPSSLAVSGGTDNN
jgi:hypothetical protein